MAIQWGSYIRGWRVGVELTVTATYDASYTIRADFYFQGSSGYNINDSNNSFNASFAGGSLSGSRSVYLTPSGGTVHLGSITRSCARVFGSTSSYSASMTLSGLEAVGGTLSASASTTTPRRPYSAPQAVSSLVGIRTTNESISLSWANGHSVWDGSQWYGADIRADGYYQNLDGTSTWAFGSTLENTERSYSRANLITDRAYTFGVAVRNADASATTWSGWIYPTPLAPTGCSAARNSDTRNTVSWTPLAPAYPSTFVLVERQTNGGSWVQVASVAPTATSYADTSTAANSYYRYRVRTVYGNKYSGYSTSGYTYNTPGKPSNVRASKNTDNSVTVSWTDNSRTETGFSLQRSQDAGATWVTVTSNIAANSTSYTDTAAPGGSLTYRVQATRGSLVSAWSDKSPSITTIAPPKVPTIADYPQATVSIEDGGFTFGWIHNPADGSAQTAAHVAILPPGSSTETFVSVTGTTSAYRLDTTATGQYRISVRTKGVHADWSLWASYVYVTIAEPPTVIISDPASDGYVVTTIPLVTSWSYSQPEGHALTALTYTITDSSDRVVYARSNPGGSSITLDASTWMPRNSETYRLAISVRSAVGLTATAERIFSVAYVPPTEPDITVTYDSEQLSAQVMVVDGIGGVIPESYTLIRVTDDGETILAADLASGAVVGDAIPPLNVAYKYRVIGHAASGAISETDVAAYVDSPSTFALNYGDGLTEVARLEANAAPSGSVRKEQQLVQYQGRNVPVLHYGDFLERTWRLSGDIFPATREAMRSWERLDYWAGPCVYRSNRGHVVTVIASHEWSEPAGRDIPSVEVELSEVELP